MNGANNMSDQYEPEVLRKLQIVQCMIMEDYIKICEENNLDYFLFSGCAIGVERHGGFVPWDDDVDIAMLRSDYEKFKEIAIRDYSDKYDVLEISEDPKFPFFNMEFNRKGTINLPEIFKDCPSAANMGIGVAIYAYDNVADTKWKRRFQLWSVFFWHKIKILKEFGHPVLFFKGWKRKVVSAICIFAHAVLNILPISHSFINKRFMKSATKYNNTDTKLMSCFFDTTPMAYAMERSEIFPLKKKKFEYLMVNVPNKNHESLTRRYGDYMQLPPEEDRKNHYPYKLEFGPLDEEYSKFDY